MIFKKKNMKKLIGFFITLFILTTVHGQNNTIGSDSFYGSQGIIGAYVPTKVKKADSIAGKKLTANQVMLSAQSKELKLLNIALDTIDKKLYLSIKTNVTLKSFDPEFKSFPGVSISPKSKANFSKGPVKYTVKMDGQNPQTYQVFVNKNHNPVLDGYYADPEVLYAEKTGKFYIYPTSDGFTGWSGTFFKTFSSDNLVDWKDEGVILDLVKDVTWAKKNATKAKGA